MKRKKISNERWKSSSAIERAGRKVSMDGSEVGPEGWSQQRGCWPAAGKSTLVIRWRAKHDLPGEWKSVPPNPGFIPAHSGSKQDAGGVQSPHAMDDQAVFMDVDMAVGVGTRWALQHSLKHTVVDPVLVKSLPVPVAVTR